MVCPPEEKVTSRPSCKSSLVDLDGDDVLREGILISAGSGACGRWLQTPQQRRQLSTYSMGVAILSESSGVCEVACLLALPSLPISKESSLLWRLILFDSTLSLGGIPQKVRDLRASIRKSTVRYSQCSFYPAEGCLPPVGIVGCPCFFSASDLDKTWLPSSSIRRVIPHLLRTNPVRSSHSSSRWRSATVVCLA